MLTRSIRTLSTALVVLFALSANAGILVFDLSWDDVDFNNTGAAATGTLTVDDTVFLNTPSGNCIFDTAASCGVVDFSLSVSGTAGGVDDASYVFADFSSFIWNIGGPVDLSTEVVGQANFFDFNIFGDCVNSAPQGTGPNVFLTCNTDELLRLSSFAPASTSVPEPPLFAMIGLGLIGIGLARRRARA